MKPAVRAVRAVEEEDGDQEERGEAQEREDDRRMLEAFVIDLHGDDHDYQAGYGPD